MKPPPTTIHALVCSMCGVVVSTGTRVEALGTVCHWCPVGAGRLTVHRYQLAPQKSRNARKSRAR